MCLGLLAAIGGTAALAAGARVDSVVEADFWDSLDGDRTKDDVVETEGRGLVFVVNALPRELLRGLILGGAGPTCSGIDENGGFGLRLVRYLLLFW